METEEAVAVIIIAMTMAVIAFQQAVVRAILLGRAGKVVTGPDHRQFRVTLGERTGHNEVVTLSVIIPPHRRREVIRAIQAWATLQERKVVAIQVNSEQGGCIFNSMKQ